MQANEYAAKSKTTESFSIMGIGLDDRRLRLDFVQGGARTTITANCETDQDLQFAIRFSISAVYDGQRLKTHTYNCFGRVSGRWLKSGGRDQVSIFTEDSPPSFQFAG